MSAVAQPGCCQNASAKAKRDEPERDGAVRPAVAASRRGGHRSAPGWPDARSGQPRLGGSRLRACGRRSASTVQASMFSGSARATPCAVRSAAASRPARVCAWERSSAMSRSGLSVPATSSRCRIWAVRAGRRGAARRRSARWRGSRHGPGPRRGRTTRTQPRRRPRQRSAAARIAGLSRRDLAAADVRRSPRRQRRRRRGGRPRASASSEPARTTAISVTAGISQSQSSGECASHTTQPAIGAGGEPRARPGRRRARRCRPRRGTRRAAPGRRGPARPASGAASEWASWAPSANGRQRSQSTAQPPAPTPCIGCGAEGPQRHPPVRVAVALQRHQARGARPSGWADCSWAPSTIASPRPAQIDQRGQQRRPARQAQAARRSSRCAPSGAARSAASAAITTSATSTIAPSRSRVDADPASEVTPLNGAATSAASTAAASAWRSARALRRGRGRPRPA